MQNREPAELTGSPLPLWLGLGAAIVLGLTALMGSHTPPAEVKPAAAMAAPSAMAAAAQAPAAAAAATAMAPAAMAPQPAATTTPAVAMTQAAPVAATTTAADASLPKPEVSLDDLYAAGPLPDNVMGDPKAPVTIVEYASMACPHCADFHQHTWPALKTKYIDTNKVRFIFREYPLDNLAAAVSELARCLGPMRYFAFIGTMFDHQDEWHTGSNDLPRVQEMAKQAGFTDESFNKCVKDTELLGKINAARKLAHDKFGVDATPTFFVNGVRMKTGHEIADFDTALAPYQKS